MAMVWCWYAFYMCCFSFNIQTCYHYYTNITHGHKGRAEEPRFKDDTFTFCLKCQKHLVRPMFKRFLFVDELDTFLKFRAGNILTLVLSVWIKEVCLSKKLSPTPPTDCLLAKTSLVVWEVVLLTISPYWGRQSSCATFHLAILI